MSPTAQNPSVDGIWSTSQPGQDDGVITTPPVNPSKLGLAGRAEGGGGWEVDPVAQEMLEKARRAEQERVNEISKSAETLPRIETPESSEVGEKLKPTQIQKPANIQEKSFQEVAPEQIKLHVKDLRTGKEVTHRVDINKADSVTKTADLEEQKFIEGVEKVHSII